MKPNSNNCSDIKGLRFLLQNSVLTIIVFYTQKKKTKEGLVFIRSTNLFSWSYCPPPLPRFHRPCKTHLLTKTHTHKQVLLIIISKLCRLIMAGLRAGWNQSYIFQVLWILNMYSGIQLIVYSLAYFETS